MSFWTEIHWSEGMFLRPHHLQAGQRWLETVLRTALDGVRPFAWGFVTQSVAVEPLENFTFRLDGCALRLKDGTWVQIPDNTDVPPLDFKTALDASPTGLDIYLGLPQMQDVRANAVPLETPEQVDGTPRYEPHPLMRRDENTGKNAQMVYVRRMRGRLFSAGEDMTGYEVVRVATVKRTDRPGAAPELEPTGAGPLLAVQAHPALAALITSLSDQVEAKDEVLAREAHEHQMRFTDGVASNSEHLLKLHVMNEIRGQIKGVLQAPLLHPYDLFVFMARWIGSLSIFGEEMIPGPLPLYDHDHPGQSLEAMRRRILLLLEAMRPVDFVRREFARKKDTANRDGLEVELERSWIDDKLELFLGLQADEMEINELQNHLRNTVFLKLASPTRAPRIINIAVRGLGWEIRPVPAGTLPRRQGLHYFKIDKTIGVDRTDYWRECEQEKGIRFSTNEGHLSTLEKYKPALYVILKR